MARGGARVLALRRRRKRGGKKVRGLCRVLRDRCRRDGRKDLQERGCRSDFGEVRRVLYEK